MVPSPQPQAVGSGLRTARPGIAVARLNAWERLLVLSSIGLIAALAWLILLSSAGLVHSVTASVAVPHPHPTGVGGLLAAVGMWFVMMVAMMLPPVLPWLLLVASVDEGRKGRLRRTSRTAVFAAGYLSIWLIYSVAGAGLQVALQKKALMGLDMRLNAVIGGALLVTAGLYQLSFLKQACLRHCRNPLSFFLARWRAGARGVFGMGLRHGAHCLGCCWALMVLSFALGLMNLLWMAALTVILCVEKLTPSGRLWSRAFGWGFAVWGAWAILTAAG